MFLAAGPPREESDASGSEAGISIPGRYRYIAAGRITAAEINKSFKAGLLLPVMLDFDAYIMGTLPQKPGNMKYVVPVHGKI